MNTLIASAQPVARMAAQPQVSLIASPRTWMNGEAVRQLHAAARWPGVRRAVGFPNLHAGRAQPAGLAVVTTGSIHPRLIGPDIGCGLTLFRTELAPGRALPDAWSRHPLDLERPPGACADELRSRHALAPTPCDVTLGTLGGGSHFAELLAVEEIPDPDAGRELGLEPRQLLALVHAGANGLGESLLQTTSMTVGLDPASSAGVEFLHGHDHALRWARANRELIGHQFGAGLGTKVEPLWDCCHNHVSRQGDGGHWVHRRGVGAAGGPVALVAGSRGSFSYLVRSLTNQARHAWSLAQTCGRKWARSESRLRMRERYAARHLALTPLGGRVICDDRDLLYEEAPDAFKDSQHVVGDLIEEGLVSIVATLRPVLTYKRRRLEAAAP